jgi:hypothetical protein
MDERDTRITLPARLGNVLYWIAQTVAILCICLGVLGFVVQQFHLIQDEPSMADNIFVLAFGMAVWAAARVMRSILVSHRG